MVTAYDALEKRRARLGMSKKALASRAHISVPTVNRILSGKQSDISASKLGRIAKALGVVVRLGEENPEVEESQSADEYLRAEARRKAAKLIDLVQGTMALEAQGVDQEYIEEMVEKTTYELLNSRRRLWGD